MATQKEFREMMKNPQFIKMMEEQAQKAVEEERKLSKLNYGESRVVLKDVYVNKGKEKTTKDGKLIINQSTGETQRWSDKYNLTFANLSFSKQIEVKPELFEQYKDRVDEYFIIIYELVEVNDYGNLNLSLKIKKILTPEEYKEREDLIKQEEIKKLRDEFKKEFDIK